MFADYVVICSEKKKSTVYSKNSETHPLQMKIKNQPKQDRTNIWEREVVRSPGVEIERRGL